MGSKHDILTEQELSGFQVSNAVLTAITEFQETVGRSAGQINVLDWGCGRGRSVAKLRELGFNAFGVEIDDATMKNGFDLFHSRGLKPNQLLRNIEDISDFADGYFDFVFSEQVFEHVKDLMLVAKEQARLTKINGVGLHCFPSSHCVEEGHLFMPFVHWLPKNRLRKVSIMMMLALGKGPPNGWPEIRDRPLSHRAEVFYQYLNNKTYYRDIDTICQIFTDVGFDSNYALKGPQPRRQNLIPAYLRRNGFPNRSVHLHLRRLS